MAAAAGLLIGLLGGQLVHIVPQQTRRLAPMATSIAPSAPSRVRRTWPFRRPPTTGFLEKSSYAVQVRSPAELRALDELTLIDDPR